VTRGITDGCIWLHRIYTVLPSVYIIYITLKMKALDHIIKLKHIVISYIVLHYYIAIDILTLHLAQA